jgi:hypothetical protein
MAEKSILFSTRISETLKLKLKQRALREKTTVQELVRRLLEEGLKA